MVLAMTHEEPVTDLCAERSPYRQSDDGLPIQTKFRDSLAPGVGLAHPRVHHEGRHSAHTDYEDLDRFTRGSRPTRTSSAAVPDAVVVEADPE